MPRPGLGARALVATSTRNERNPEGFDIHAPFRLPYSVKRVRSSRAGRSSTSDRARRPRARPAGSPVQFVKGVGPQRAAALAKTGVATVEDLLFHLPLRYEDRRSFARIARPAAGDEGSVSGTIAVAGLRRARRMTLYEVRLEDESGRLKALWFNQPFLKDDAARAAAGRALRRGRARRLRRRPPDDVARRSTRCSRTRTTPGVHTGRIVPVYEKLGPLSGQGAAARARAAGRRAARATCADPLPDGGARAPRA